MAEYDGWLLVEITGRRVPAHRVLPPTVAYRAVIGSWWEQDDYVTFNYLPYATPDRMQSARIEWDVVQCVVIRPIESLDDWRFATTDAIRS